jgi:hypothetical protein
MGKYTLQGRAHQAFVFGEEDCNTSIDFTHRQLDEHCGDGDEDGGGDGKRVIVTSICTALLLRTAPCILSYSPSALGEVQGVADPWLGK